MEEPVKQSFDDKPSEYAGRSVDDVAVELMRKAPEAAYTKPKILEDMGNEDDALMRIRMLKQSGLLN